jgi:GAF domain-containing protein
MYSTTGLSYQIKVGLLPSIAVGLIFITIVFVSNYLLFERLSTAYTEMKERNIIIKELHQRAESKNQKFETYQQTIYNLTKHIAQLNGNIQESYEAICSQAAVTMQISRVSIWELSQDNNYMTRRYLYHAASNSTTEAALLCRNDTPNYFNTIINRQFIAAQQASAHPDTREFSQHYLEPLHIISMLDAPIDIDGDVYGVICCEHQHNAIDWQAEDIMFAQMIAGLVAQSIKSERINKLLEQVREQNNDLKENNAEILTLNEELQSTMDQLRLTNQQLEVLIQERTEQNEHISALNTQLASSLEKIQLMNEELEKRVAERTHTLEQQNIQLNEYAFINSHLLRAPLSRILGLAHLITDSNDTTDASITQALISSCDELDNIIRKISELLYEGNNFSRADIKAIIQRNLNVNK